MTFGAIDAWWWPFLFILVAGWLATDSWRYLGVYFGGRISDQSEAMVFVRAIATAFVASVIGNLIVFPGGELADAPVMLRIAAAAIGFAAFLAKPVLPQGVSAGHHRLNRKIVDRRRR